MKFPFQPSNVRLREQRVMTATLQRQAMFMTMIVIVLVRQDLENNCSVLTREVNGTIPSADYDAELEITSTGTVENQSIVNFIAGQSVKLLPGFKAETGSQFRAKNCGLFANAFE